MERKEKNNVKTIKKESNKNLTSILKLLSEIHSGVGQNRCGRRGHQKQRQRCHYDELKQPVQREIKLLYLLTRLSIYLYSRRISDARPLLRSHTVTLRPQAQTVPTRLLSARNRCLNLIGRRPQTSMRKRFSSQPIGKEIIWPIKQIANGGRPRVCLIHAQERLLEAPYRVKKKKKDK